MTVPSLRDNVLMMTVLSGDYVDKLLSQHKEKVTVEELCVLLAGKVNDASKHSKCFHCPSG
jgi:hypothetical protein